MAFAFGVAQPLVGDPDSAGEADGFVDDHHLAVRSMVEQTEMQTPERRNQRTATGFLEQREQRSLDRVCAPRVEEHAQRAPSSVAIGQRPGEQPADLHLSSTRT